MGRGRGGSADHNVGIYDPRTLHILVNTYVRETTVDTVSIFIRILWERPASCWVSKLGDTLFHMSSSTPQR